VITAANTFIATAGAIVQAGARPVFVDVLDDFNLDPGKIEAAITPRTKALLPVHYAGQPAKMKAVMEIASRHRLPVVEDACQAITAAINGTLVSNFGVAAGFSLHPLKNLNVWGDGGVIVTNSQELDRTLRLLRNHGLKNRDEVEIFGYNCRLDTLQAIVGNHLIRDTEAITAVRIKNAFALDAGLVPLVPRVRLPRRLPNERHVFHLYMFEADDRDRLLAFLHEREIEAKVHYPVPLHLQPAGRRLGYKDGDFPIAEKQAKRIITLPVHQHLTRDQVQFMVDSVTAFYRR